MKRTNTLSNLLLTSKGIYQIMENIDLTDLEFKALLHLYNEYNAAFKMLPNTFKMAFYKRLYQK